MADDRGMSITQREFGATQAPLDVLVIDEEIVVHHPDRLDIGSADEHRRAADEADAALDIADIGNAIRGLFPTEQAAASQPWSPLDSAPGLHQAARGEDETAADDS